MKYLLTAVTALLASASLTFAADAAADAKDKKGEKKDPEVMFKKLDGNADGSVSLDEIKAGKMGQKDPAKAEAMFKKKDKDSDGKLTLEEFSAGGKKEKKDS